MPDTLDRSSESGRQCVARLHVEVPGFGRGLHDTIISFALSGDFMHGTELLNEIKNRIKKRDGRTVLTDLALAEELGISQPTLSMYRNRDLSAKQIANLMESYAKRAESRLVDRTITPIVEFLHLDPYETRQGTSWQLFSPDRDGGTPRPYLVGLRERLDNAHGIYVFHDSRGRAIYAGKAQQMTLWKEMNNAFNRDRKEVQNIKVVDHPIINLVSYRGPEEVQRRISKRAVALHHIASYVSAYEVPDALIGKFEALIVRAFANDLLNVRMENF